MRGTITSGRENGTAGLVPPDFYVTFSVHFLSLRKRTQELRGRAALRRHDEGGVFCCRVGSACEPPSQNARVFKTLRRTMKNQMSLLDKGPCTQKICLVSTRVPRVSVTTSPHALKSEAPARRQVRFRSGNFSTWALTLLPRLLTAMSKR